MDEIQLKKLMEEYGDDIFRLCLLYLKDYHLAEDATQDTFISVYEKYKKFNNQSNIKTWITRIAINHCKMIMRKNFFKNERTDINDLFAQSTGDNKLEQTENDYYVTSAVMNLPMKEKEAVIIYYYQELSIKEGARVLGIQESAFSQRLKRGRDRLRKELKGSVIL